jgi:uncharacterized membrane protein
VLIILPLCLLGISVLFDAAGRLSGTPVWGILAYANLVAGILIALFATGMQVLESRIHPCRTGSYHMIFMNHLLNLAALVLFGISLVYRIHDPSQLPDSTAFFASVFGLFVLAIGGWLSALRPSLP